MDENQGQVDVIEVVEASSRGGTWAEHLRADSEEAKRKLSPVKFKTVNAWKMEEDAVKLTWKR